MPNIGKPVSWSFSLSQGLSTALSTLYSLKSIVGDYVGWGIAGSTFAGLVDAFSSYNFQGASIRKSGAESYITIEDENGTEKNPPLTNPQKMLSVDIQLAYTTLDFAKTFTNRYFLISTLSYLFDIPLNWYVVGTDVAIKQIFNLTNETYEANAAIANYFTHDETPFYKKLLNPFSYLIPRKLIKFLGSVEHTLGDDLLPWLAMMPKSWILEIGANPLLRNILLATGVPLGTALGLLVLIQTYLFEGEHTEDHLTNEKSTMMPIPLSIRKFLDKSLNLMSPLHGMATAAPIFLILNDLIEDPAVKWSLSITLGICAFLSTTLGNQMSEVREAKQKLWEAPYPRTFSTETSLLIQSDEFPQNLSRKRWLALC